MTNLTSVYIIGHIHDKVAMAGIGMGNVLIGTFFMAFCFGLNGTLESKVSQAYGSKNFEMCGVWLNRGRIINTLIMLPIMILFALSEKMLVAIDMDPEVSRHAKNYCCLMIPGVWAMIQFDATKRFCTSQFKSTLPFYT